ncbi:MAG: glycosyltransferase family 2 protein [Lachnospiraceae bacterium]|nr:glycosyltransferase family 2 protein [Lachnospiraceae bacterium]
MKRYSVLIPAYNAEKFIVDCVESVINQSDINPVELFDSVEIVIANDGSIDSTGEICDKLTEKYCNIRVFHKENEGLLLTRQFLLQKASANYILYLDADDKLEDNLLKTLNAYIEQYEDPDIISFGFNLWKGENYLPYDNKNTLLYCDKKEKTWAFLLCQDTYNSIWSKAIKREILLKSNVDKSLENIRRGEDKLLLIACFEVARNILFVPERLYDYRIDNSSMTRTFKPNYFAEIIVVDKFAFEKLMEHTSGTEEYLIRWGANLVGKYIEYVLSAFSSLERNKALGYINNYASDDTLKRAISYAKKSKEMKTKVKAYAVSLKLYSILHLIYQRRQ